MSVFLVCLRRVGVKSSIEKVTDFLGFKAGKPDIKLRDFCELIEQQSEFVLIPIPKQLMIN